MTVSVLANRDGLSRNTIRYCENAGLLPAPDPTAPNCRAHSESVLERLQFIRGAQRLGLRLPEIKTLLEVRDTGQCQCEPAEQLLRARIAEIDEEMRRLRMLRAELVAIADGISSRTAPVTLVLSATNR